MGRFYQAIFKNPLTQAMPEAYKVRFFGELIVMFLYAVVYFCYTFKWNESDTLKWTVFAGGCLWMAYFVFIRIFVLFEQTPTSLWTLKNMLLHFVCAMAIGGNVFPMVFSLTPALNVVFEIIAPCSIIAWALFDSCWGVPRPQKIDKTTPYEEYFSKEELLYYNNLTLMFFLVVMAI